MNVSPFALVAALALAEPAPTPSPMPVPAAPAPAALALPPDAEHAKDALAKSPRHGEWVDIKMPSGPALKSFVVYPERKDKAPVVLVIHDIFGMGDWARAVGDSGRVYAEEIEPPLVAYLAERARSEGTPQVVPIYGAPADPRLPGDLDLIFLCNVYRYIDGRRAFFRRLLPNLARSGRVAIVDWRPTDNSPNRLPAQRVVAEMGAAGYRLIREPTFLPKQYFLVFGRAEEPGPR